MIQKSRGIVGKDQLSFLLLQGSIWMAKENLRGKVVYAGFLLPYWTSASVWYDNIPYSFW